MFSERGDAAVRFGLMVAAAAVAVLLIYMAVDTSVRNSRFYTQFREGGIQISSSYIELGGKGNPVTSDLPEWVPGGGSLDESPKLFKVEDCIFLPLPKKAVGVFAATEFPKSELVEIILPPKTSGMMNVCVPEGVEVQVVLWIKN